MNPSDVINWSEAMQQVGDDEEFLRELLADLRTETESQLGTIAVIIENPSDAPYHRIMRAAHVIKGAAANLMCGQLRLAAMQLEQAASAAHDATQGGTAQPAQPLLLAVQQSHAAMRLAGQNFLAFLQSIGV